MRARMMRRYRSYRIRSRMRSSVWHSSLHPELKVIISIVWSVGVQAAVGNVTG